jgi:16S rRNA (guanine(966)-N(2))-methyltransferase RsmD
VRIVAGTLGGRRLAAPAGRATRPTSDKVREAVFAILGPPPPDAQVLDLFAGSGAMAIEALSRGAARATLVDSARGAIATARANLAELGVADRATVLGTDALAFLRGLHDGPAFSWVFIDPPYATALAADALVLLGAMGTDRLAADAIIVIEHDRRKVPPDAAGNLVRTDQRRYGDTHVSFYRRAP